MNTHQAAEFVIETIRTAKASILKNGVADPEFLNAVCNRLAFMLDLEAGFIADLLMKVEPSIKKFQVGQTITSRSVCDSNCIFSLEIISRTEKTATVKIKGEKELKRCKIHLSDGVEKMYALGSYSMAPVFSAK